MSCPICKIALIKDDNNHHSQRCPTCYREYFPIEQKQSSPLQNKPEYPDIETVSETAGDANPILLCSEDDTANRFYQYKKENDYEKMLRRYFGNHVEIDTYEEIPPDDE